jgi:hypothetical protein
LTAAGHGTAAQLGLLTERQLLLLFAAEQRRSRRTRAEALADMNHAFVGGRKAMEYQRKLLKD